MAVKRTFFNVIYCGTDNTEIPAEAANESDALSVVSGMPWWGWLLIAGAVFLLAALVIVIVRRKKNVQPKKKAGKKPDELPTTEIPGVKQQEADKEGLLPVRIGKVHEQGSRDYQEDSFSVSPEEMYADKGLLVVLADGMGGLGGGDRVSQTAVSAMMNQFYNVQEEGLRCLLTLLSAANGAANASLGISNIGKSGSTLAAGLLQDGCFWYISVGDSRICLYRDGICYQLNRDHVFRNELALRAVNGDGTLDGAWTHPKASGLTSFIGMGQIKYLDIPGEAVRTKPGDRFVLMSDGVYNALTKEELCKCLELEAQEAADAIRDAVQQKAWPGQDNYTAIVLEIK